MKLALNAQYKRKARGTHVPGTRCNFVDPKRR